MKIGIFGLSAGGKTTLFSLLTGADIEAARGPRGRAIRQPAGTVTGRTEGGRHARTLHRQADNRRGQHRRGAVEQPDIPGPGRRPRPVRGRRVRLHRALGPDRDRNQPARRGRARAVPHRVRLRGERHRTAIAGSLPARRADIVPHRRRGRSPRLDGPARHLRPRCRGRDSHPAGRDLHPGRGDSPRDLHDRPRPEAGQGPQPRPSRRPGRNRQRRRHLPRPRRRLAGRVYFPRRTSQRTSTTSPASTAKTASPTATASARRRPS